MCITGEKRCRDQQHAAGDQTAASGLEGEVPANISTAASSVIIRLHGAMIFQGD